MVMLAEQYEYVIGGDPDRDGIDLAVVDTATGAVRGHCSDRADAHGYTRLLGWAARQAPGRRVWALEGTGSFASGLATVLAEAGEDVVEVSGGKRTPRGQKRPDRRCPRCPHRAGPRAASRAPGAGASRGAAADSRYPAGRSGQPHESHQRAEEPYRGRSGTPARPSARRAASHPAAAHHRTDQPGTSHRREPRHRVNAAIDRRPHPVPDRPGGRARARAGQACAGTSRRPGLAARARCWSVVAAQLLVSWSHRGRVRSEAAFASLAGVAPPRSQQRSACPAPAQPRRRPRPQPRTTHTVAITRLRCHAESRAYEIKRTAQGKTHRDIRRSLKRALARRLYRRIQAATTPAQTGDIRAPNAA